MSMDCKVENRWRAYQHASGCRRAECGFTHGGQRRACQYRV